MDKYKQTKYKKRNKKDDIEIEFEDQMGWWGSKQIHPKNSKS